MHSQKMRLLSLNLVLVMLLTMLPVQAADIVVDDDGPMYTVVLNGNGGTYEGDNTLSISYGNRPLYLENYIFTREGYTLLGWSKNEDASALDYTRFGELYAFDIGNDTQLYAVWGEGENCALYTDAIPSADFIQLGQYYVVNSETLPAVNESGFVAWYDHINGVYYAEDTVRAGEVYRPIRVSTGNYPILLEGNGGESTFGSSLFYSTNGNYIRASYSSKGRNMLCFRKDDFILSGWENSNGDVVAISGAPLFGLCTPSSSGIITLRAHWSPAYQLTGGTKLVINGDEMNELSDTESHGSGWNYHPNGSLYLYNPRGNSEPYSFGSFAYDGGMGIAFDQSICTGQIEANGSLTFSGNNASREICILTQNTPAIHAERVSFWGEQATYRIVAENAVGIDAPYVDFDSPNITITGNPAVRADAKIICGSGIGYTISEDKTMLTTYAIDQKITLNGNGGTFAGRETVVTNYDVNNKLDLSQYAFTREGFALIGWSADANGSNFVTEHDGKISGASYPELYAVWLAVPKDTGYAIFEFWGRNGERTIPDAFSSYTSSMTYCCMAVTDNFIMPETLSDNDRYPVVWRSASDYSLYVSGEHTTLTSGTIFKSAVSIYEKDTHIIMLDGNGGTYMTGLDNVEYCASRSVETGSYPVGATVNYARSFTRPGYKLVSYNSEPDGSGTEYALNKCTVTADMAPIQILYAQWKEIEESGQYITVDGKQYDAAQDWSGNGWEYRHYENSNNVINLNSYSGGAIESDAALQVICYSGENNVTGGISAPELNVNIYTYSDSGGASLNLHTQKGAALISQGNMQINVQDLAELSVVGAEGYPAVSVGGELNLWLWREGRFSAQGGKTAAILAESINNNRGNDCVITAGTSSKDAAEVDRYTGQQYVSYEVRTKTLTLHGSGGTADGKDSISVDTKESYIDLSQYANTFSNGRKVLLGWSRVGNETSVDYPNSSDARFSFDSGISHADIYAVWDSNEQKGVVLNDYGQQFYDELNHYGGYNYVDQYTVVAAAGTQYTLPDSYKAGYRFLGWRSAQDGELYSAGTAITVEQSMTYTAEYEVLSMTINGKTYGMDKAHGSRSLGWEYRPAYEYGYRSDQVYLNIYENYSGKPIRIPSNAYIQLGGNITGTNDQPAISVDGNAQIYSDATQSKKESVMIIGGVDAPAIQVSENLTLGLDYLWDRNGMSLMIQSDSGQPALKAKTVSIGAGSLLFVGSSERDEVLTSAYNDQSFVRISDSLTLKAGQTVPSMQNANGMKFVAWQQKGSTNWDNAVWYRPGDVIEDNEKTLVAVYTSTYNLALIFDGNGGTTASGSKYYVTAASGGDLQLMTPVFTRDGYSLRSYNDRADGSGTSYTVQQLVEKQDWFDVMAGKVLTFFAQWTRNGNTPVTPGEPTTPPQTTTPDGSADITVSGSTVKVENVDVDKLVTDNGDKKTAEIDLSGTKSGITDVTLPTDAVKELATSEAESLTVKLPDVTVSFDDKALAAVAEQSSGADLSLSVNVGAANNSNLTGAQKNAITGARELSVIEVSLSSNGEKISNFNGGSVTIDVPFQWSMKGLLRAYYIDENGNKSAIDVTYKNGVATLVLNHFSIYVVEAVDALSFTDVSAKAYYFDAVAWAVKNKITSGQSDTLFAPDTSCTRAQMVTFLWRANGSPAPKTTEMPFTDVSKDAYYYDAVLWASENGITTGTGETTFSPNQVISRAEAVTFLWRAAGKPIAEGSLFADVESTKYYAEAVRWAVTSGITNGMSDSTFAPNDICTRAHIVTFLYRTHRSK